MIAFGCAIASEEKYERFARPGIERALEPGAPVFLKRGRSSIFSTYNEILDDFTGHNAQLIGISVDGVWCHAAYARDRKLHFPLLADFEPKGEVARSYGVYRHKDGVCERALFVIDQDGTIEWSYVSPLGVNPGAAHARRRFRYERGGPDRQNVRSDRRAHGDSAGRRHRHQSGAWLLSDDHHEAQRYGLRPDHRSVRRRRSRGDAQTCRGDRRLRSPSCRVAGTGGHGRTGTALACLAVLDGVPNDRAVAYVREHYAPRAVETPWQRRFVARFR